MSSAQLKAPAQIACPELTLLWLSLLLFFLLNEFKWIVQGVNGVQYAVNGLLSDFLRAERFFAAISGTVYDDLETQTSQILLAKSCIFYRNKYYS